AKRHTGGQELVLLVDLPGSGINGRSNERRGHCLASDAPVGSVGRPAGTSRFALGPPVSPDDQESIQLPRRLGGPREQRRRTPRSRAPAGRGFICPPGV